MVESLLTENVAGVPSKLTDVAPVNPDPTMPTLVPPVRGPEFGVRRAIVGTG